MIVKIEMLRKVEFLKSPAVPAVLLLYVIVFAFAAVYYLDVPWQRKYTIILYFMLLVWAVTAIVLRWRNAMPSFNRVDFWFVVFLAQVLLSTAINWWEGTIKYLEFMPIFFVVPYVLGRAMNRDDVAVFQDTLIWLGAALLLLIPFEFLRMLRFGLPYSNSPNPTLFGQGHGVMLSGLLLAATFLTLVSLALRPETQCERCAGFWRRYAPYLGLGLIVLVMSWISARGSALAAIVSMIVLFIYSSRRGSKKKVKVALVFLTFLVLATLYSQQNRYSSTYYHELIQKPPIAESLGKVATIEKRQITSEFEPILGKGICSTIVDSVTDRWVHYQQALAIFMARPIFGVGANAYGFHACTGPGSFPHSTLLQVLAEFGVIGALPYLALIWAVAGVLFNVRFRDPRDETVHSIAAWILAYFVFQFLITQLNGNYFFNAGFYLACGLVAGLLEQSWSRTGRKASCAS